ncbi:MAG: MotA/TolQ/ExbB proton channel family protein [Kiritimatiellia bacterium]
MDELLEFLSDLMQRGGPVMWPIAVCSIVTVLMTLRKLLTWLSHALATRCGGREWGAVLAALSQGEEAKLLAWRHPLSPYTRILRLALRQKKVDFNTALEQAAHRTVRHLRSGLGLLDTIVTLAPMLGILGTVTGIISSFDLMGAAGVEDPSGVTAGISEALITTAAGLTVSILALLPLNYGRSWCRDAVRELEEAMTAAEAAKK